MANIDVETPGSDQTALLRAFQALGRGFNDLKLPNYKLMASPPTVTVGASGAVSAITGAANATVSIAGNSALCGVKGGVDTLFTTGYYYGGASARGGYHKRFQHTGNRFEFRLRGATVSSFSIFVDGELVDAGWQGGIRTGGDQLVLVDFGSNTETFYPLHLLTITNGGTGYVLDEVITLTGGTASAQATLRVTAVSGGVITGIRLETLGSYSVKPANPIAQGSTTGVGTGATFTVLWGSQHTTRKPRMIDLVFGYTSYFGGLNIDTTDAVVPWPMPAGWARRLIVGDSFFESYYNLSPARHMGASIDRMLNDCDTWTYGISGMGWTSGGGVQLSSNLAPIVAAAPNRMTIMLGTNDTGQADATITAAVTSNLQSLRASLPDCLISVIAGLETTNAKAAVVVSAVNALADAKMNALNMYDGLPSGTTFQISDSFHPHQVGHDHLAYRVANQIGVLEAALMAF